MLQFCYFLCFMIWKFLHEHACLLFILCYIIDVWVHTYMHPYLPTYLPTCPLWTRYFQIYLIGILGTSLANIAEMVFVKVELSGNLSEKAHSKTNCLYTCVCIGSLRWMSVCRPNKQICWALDSENTKKWN